MKRYKKWVIAFLAANAIMFALITVMIYVMDPLQYFRPITFYKPPYCYHERRVIPGIIRNYDFDAIILGSSTAANSKPSQVEQLFGVTCVKFTVMGARAGELSMFFEESAKRRKIKLVIHGVDLFAFTGATSKLRPEQPEYLYGLGPTTFYKYFYDAYILKKTLTKTDWSSVFDSKQYAFDHDLFAADNKRKTSSRKKLVESYSNPNFNGSFYYRTFLQDSRINFRHNVVRIAREHPDTIFHLYLSPSSILDWLIRDGNGDLENLLELRTFIAEECQNLKNVRLYDFQSDKSITHNLDTYFDITHYDRSINALIISNIHAGRNITNPEKCKQANKDIRQQIATFKAEVFPTLKQK